MKQKTNYSPQFLGEMLRKEGAIVIIAVRSRDAVTTLMILSLVVISSIFIITGSKEADGAEMTVDGVPSAPRNLTAERFGRKIILNWSEPEYEGDHPLTKFVIERSDNGNHFSIWTRIESEILSYEMENYYWGEVNYFRILAENVNGTSAPSNIASILMADKPDAPRFFSAKARNDRIELSWTEPHDDGGVPVTEYHVIRTLDVNDYDVLAILNGSVKKYIDNDVEQGVMYYYGVRAYNLMGASPAPSLTGVTPFGPPTEPLDLKLYNIDNKNVIQWKPPLHLGGGKIIKFHVMRGPTQDMIREYALKSPDEFVHTLDDHTLGEGYYYAVKAENEFGISPLSNILFVKLAGVPGYPVNFVAKYRVDHVTLTWEPPLRNGGSNVTSYNIYREFNTDSDHDKKVLIATVDWWVTSYIDDDEKIEDGGDLIYYIHPVNQNGEGDFSSDYIYTDDNEFSWTFTLILLGILIGPAAVTWMISGLTHGGRMKRREKRKEEKKMEDKKKREETGEKNDEDASLTENDRKEMKNILEGMK